MPYLIYTPARPAPYVLDDEDAHFLKYFTRWAWRYEHRSASDPAITRAIKRELQDFRAPLYKVWEDECARRARAAKERDNQASKALIEERREVRKEALGKEGLRRKLTGSSARRKVEENKDIEIDGYKNGLYVNHLEDLQKKWAEEDK